MTKRNRRRNYHPAHGYDAEASEAQANAHEAAALDFDSEYDLDSSTSPAIFTGDPSAVIPKGRPLVVPQKRYFKLAPHQRLLETHALGRFGVALEGEYGFKVLRDPRTGWPVARDHGDLKPGEVSLVLE